MTSPTVDAPPAAATISDLVKECREQTDSCLYTAVTLHLWLRRLRRWQAAFTVVPLVLGTFAGWSVIKELQNPVAQGVASFAALLAGLLPAIYTGLKVDGQIDQGKRLAAEFTNLRDRFRQLAIIGGAKSLAQFETELRPLMKRLEAARREAVTPPEACFQEARKKIKRGDYDPDEPRK
jgi:hypothetical protein